MNEQTQTLKKKILSYVWEASVYIGVFLATLILYITVKPNAQFHRNGVLPQTLMAFGLFVLLAVGVSLFWWKKLTYKRLIILLLLAGYILRVGYMLYTASTSRQYDTWTKNFDGHEAYAWTIFSTGALPTNNVYQFYHPPLNAMVQSAFMYCMQGLTNGLTSLFALGDYFPMAFAYAKPEYVDETRYFLYSSCQILSVLYSFVVAFVSVKTIALFDFSNKTKLVAAAFVIFYPRNIQVSAQLNNDGISFMLGILAIYFALKWQKGGKQPLWILLCAVAVGLGMMSKLSSATVCLPIAGIFIYEFIRTLRKKQDSLRLPKMIIQYVLFLAVCAPLGLWFQVYAYQAFGQEFGYVFSNLNHKLSTAHYSFFERFIFAFDAKEWFGSLYCRPFDYNYYLFHYALRSSIFGEFSYWQGEGFAVTATVFAYLAAGALLVGLVWCLTLYIKNRKKEESFLQGVNISFADLLFVFLFMQSQVLSETYFYIKMPYACTMDFRYIMPMILAMGLTLAFVHKTLVAEGGKVSVAINRVLLITCGLFLLSSSLFYCVCI